MESNQPETAVLQAITKVIQLTTNILQGHDSAENKLNLMTELKFLSSTFSSVSESRDEVASSSSPSDGLYASLADLITKCNSEDIVLECLRVIRNSVAGHPVNQDLVNQHQHLLDTVGRLAEDASVGKQELLTKVSATLTQDLRLLLTKLSIQVLVNLAVNHPANVKHLHRYAYTCIFPGLQLGVQEAGFLLNTLLKVDPSLSTITIDTNEKFAELINHSDMESVIVCLETLASDKRFLETRYDHMEGPRRIAFLQLLSTSPCLKSVLFFTERFKRLADAILKATTEEIESNFEEFLLLTCIIAGLSSSDELHVLQADNALVISVSHLFLMTRRHRLFDPIEKLANLSEDEKNHPAFMFKAHLTRTLGNLAYKHTANQSLIGSGCLEMILDSTRIDALNPFITQWSIFAIRNLLENHEGNQQFVRSLRIQRTAYSQVLEEFGISLKIDEESKLKLDKS